MLGCFAIDKIGYSWLKENITRILTLGCSNGINIGHSPTYTQMEILRGWGFIKERRYL